MNDYIKNEAERLADDLRANESTVDRDSIERSLRRLGLAIVTLARLQRCVDGEWERNPERMGR